MQMMRAESQENTLLLGGSGFLGSYFAESLSKGSIIHITNEYAVVSKSDFNYQNIRFDDDAALKGFLNELPLTNIVNCIALANIEKCESKPDLAEWLNVGIPKLLAEYSSVKNIRLTHISTDAVFDGGASNRREEDLPSPVSIYGKTKLAGEQCIIQTNPHALIARVNFFGHSKSNSSLFDFFYSRMLRNEPTPAYSNIYFTPLFAKETIRIINKLRLNQHAGIFHVTGDERISKFEFATRIAAIFNKPIDWIEETEAPISKMNNLRGYDLSLSNRKTRNCGINFESVNDGLQRLKSEIEGTE